MTRPPLTPASWLAALGLPCLAATWAWAHTEPPPQPTPPAVEHTRPADREEVIEDLDAVEDVTAGATAAPLASSQLLGRLHPIAVHLPIGWIILLTLWELAVALSRRNDLELCGPLLGVGALVATVPAITTGLLRARELPTDPATLDLVLEHRNLMLAATSVTLVAVLLRLARGRVPLGGRSRLLYLGLLVLASALLTVGGHHGGQLVFGVSYLPF